MMKKLLLLAAIGFAVSPAIAQQKNNSSIVMQQVGTGANIPEVTKYNAETLKKDKAERLASRGAAKGTVTGSRSHNFLDYLIAANNTPSSTLPYMWFGADMFGIYQGQAGLELDTIQFVSYGSVLMPWHVGFNDPALPGSAGKIYINNYNPYTVDSVYLYGVYGRNPSKTGLTDTMRVTLTYGDNIRSFRYSGANTKANYGYDTINVSTVRYDQIKRTADTFGSGNPVVITKDIPMNTATTMDTTSNGLEIIRVPFGVSIPAGDLVAVTATFKTGEAYTPYSDTVFRGSVNSAVPFKYNMWRPAIYGQNANQYPTYTPGNWNGGIFKTLPDTINGYGGWYIPGWAYTSASTDLEYPDIDFILSCTGCGGVSVANVPQKITNFGVYPNPANTEATVTFGLVSASDVKVSLFNSLGQLVAAKNLQNVSGGTAKFDISNLSGGIYLYTIEADGARHAGRLTIAH